MGRLMTIERRFTSSRQSLGMLNVAVGVSVFSIQDAIIKGMSGEFPVHEIIFFRCVVALPLLLLAVLVENRGLPAFRSFGLHFLRGFLLYVAFIAYYLAVAQMQIATALSIFYVAPLLVTASSGPLLGERVPPKGWIAVAIGAFGVFVILRPGFGALDPALLLPILAAVSYALSILCGRRLGRTQSGGAMALSATLVYTLASGATAFALAGLLPPQNAVASVKFLLNPWLWPDPTSFWLIALCGLISAVAFLCMGHGYRMAEASRAAPFEYAALPWSILWGYVFFATLPDPLMVIGAMIVVYGGFYALRLEGASRRGNTPLVSLSEEDGP
jgi:drug/metabolite transporter (DMT)-like permease